MDPWQAAQYNCHAILIPSDLPYTLYQIASKEALRSYMPGAALHQICAEVQVDKECTGCESDDDGQNHLASWRTAPVAAGVQLWTAHQERTAGVAGRQSEGTVQRIDRWHTRRRRLRATS